MNTKLAMAGPATEVLNGFHTFHDSLGGTLSFLVSEEDQGMQDLNGDGDSADLVLHFLQPDTGAVISSGVVALGPPQSAYGRWFPFVAREDGVDRNGDGDTVDTVLRVAELRWVRLPARSSSL